MSFVEPELPRDALPVQRVMLVASALWIVVASVTLVGILSFAREICGGGIQCGPDAAVMTFAWVAFCAAVAFSLWLIVSAFRRRAANRVLVIAIVLDLLLVLPLVALFALLGMSSL